MSTLHKASGRRPRSVTLVVTLVVALAAVIGAAATGHAQTTQDKAEAKRLYKQGKSAFELGQFGEALSFYQRAYKVLPLPALLFNIAQCHRNLGESEPASYTYKQYLRRKPDAKNRAAVEKLIADLEVKIAADRKRRAAQQKATAAQEAESERTAEAARRNADERAEGKATAPRTPRRRRKLGLSDRVPPPKTRPTSTPIYKKWWFWTVVAVAVGGGATGIYFGTRGGPELPDSQFPVWDLNE